MNSTREDIHDVMVRYCRGVDRGDLEVVRRCFHSDAQDHHSTFEGPVEEFLVWVEQEIGKYRQTMHFVGNHLAEVVGDHAVSETYAMVTHVGFAPDDPANFTSGVRYIDYLERREGVWAISERWAVRDWIRSDVGALTAPVVQAGGAPVDRMAEVLGRLGPDLDGQ